MNELPSRDRALAEWLLASSAEDLGKEAVKRRDSNPSRLLTYSRKVFLPLTQLCRDVCGYCTFAKAPRVLTSAYMQMDDVMAIARQGVEQGCKEALLTLGDKPELRYAAARDELAALGFASTIEFVHHAASRICSEAGLLPHINAGVLSAEDYALLRPVSASMGLMLESTSARLGEKGQPHYGSPDKAPAVRLASIAAAGEAGVPFTTGLLIGIGETRRERIEALAAINDLHKRYGHIQEVIIQNFRAKPDTRMANAPEPDEAELVWTIAAARLILSDDVSIQAPPNLNPGRTASLIAAGLNDWGGISPVTLDHVNPEAPWPQIDTLAAECAAQGRVLAERLTIYPRFAAEPAKWLDSKMRPQVLKLSDAEGLGRTGKWSPGETQPAPGTPESPLGTRAPALLGDQTIDRAISRAVEARSLSESEVVSLLGARGAQAEAIVAAADAARKSVCGDVVTYVVNRNINYTNICTFSCSFCAFSKTSTKAGTRDKPYNLPLEEIAERVNEAWQKGATEVCLQGGIHPRYTGQTYLDILRAVKEAQPRMHVHAFSPLEVWQGAATLGVPLTEYLTQLRDEGLGSLPGTAAEILDDEVRDLICPDKVNTQQWLEVIRSAHKVGLPTTSTIMFGHLERPVHAARHILAIRNLQLDTGGFTEFVPLPFVHMKSPVFVRGQARMGPTWRETVLMHAVGRLALNGAINSIQASWVKLGLDGAAACLAAGVNDLGGVLMNESISRAAGAAHGQELSINDLAAAAATAGRPLRRRTTLYKDPADLMADA